MTDTPLVDADEKVAGRGLHIQRRLWVVMMVAVLSGVVGATFAVFGYFNQLHRGNEQDRNATQQQQQQDAQRFQDIQQTNAFIASFLDTLEANQKCVITLLLMTPERRIRLTDDELAQLCPPVPRFQFGANPNPPAGGGSSSTTPTQPSDATTTTSTSTTTTTQPQPQPQPPEPCFSVPVVGCVLSGG